MYINSGMSPVKVTMNSPPNSQTESVSGSEYDDVYEMLISDLESYMEMFMPVEVARRMSYYLVARGHTGLAQFLRSLGRPASPMGVTGLEGNSKSELMDTDIGR